MEDKLLEDSLNKRYVDLPVVSPDADLIEVAKILLDSSEDMVIVDKGGNSWGYIDCKMVLGWLIKDEAREVYPKARAGDIAIMIKDEDKMEVTGDIESVIERINKDGTLPLFAGNSAKLNGKISLKKLTAEFVAAQKEEKKRRTYMENMVKNIMEVLPFGVAVISKDGKIIISNEFANRIMMENLVNTAEIKSIAKSNYSKVYVNKKGLYCRVSATVLDDSDFILATFIDVSNEYIMVEKLRDVQDEVEKAFTITLPDERIAARLGSIVEYIDEYVEGEPGMIRIVGVIKNGCYRHVVNMLKLIAEAFKQGLMNLPGMDKNTLVQATILHDIGKVQPDLKIGDIVNPKDVFEKGHFHAFRGASLGKSLYNISDDEYYLIKYHHHLESELPDDFPSYLLPMYRFFRLIDGLSAGITRRGSRVTMKVNNTRIYVKEESTFPSFNQEIELDVYTGYFIARPITT